jgi:cell wall-associated NlpC family hydrolase
MSANRSADAVSVLRPQMHPLLFALVLALGFAGPLQARDSAIAPIHLSPSGVIGVENAYLSPEFWIARLPDADRVLQDAATIDAQNGRMMRIDASMHLLRALPPTLAGPQVAGWIEHLARRPEGQLFDRAGVPITAAALDKAIDNRNLAIIPARQDTRYGMVVRRAALRSFPTDLRVFNSIGDTDIDRFQETALFPGTPVVIAHVSRDGQWWFVLSPGYAAWVQKQSIAEGPKAQVFNYLDATPVRVVTGAKVRTAFTPEAPRVSELQLDMGVRSPLANLPAGQPVNGQHPYTSWTIELPVRGEDGSLALVPALLQKNVDTAAGNLPLTPANVIRQAFKFLGERYGWGHDYEARDCSGFVSEVYRSMGVLLPRNTGDQAASPALKRLHFDNTDDRSKRMIALKALRVGDLIYLPGHVMLLIGRIGNAPYVIHDIHDGKYLDAGGQLRSMHLNGVSITPLMPLRFDATQDFIDRITDIVRIDRSTEFGGAP